jgi:DNA integrity scanning protein DisA with diadenylate cyclase activity
MIASEDRILAARCTLPITQRQDIPAHYGMRHRAAIGISEVCDASVIVVSEETGDISFVSGGQIKTMESITELRLAIENSYK